MLELDVLIIGSGPAGYTAGLYATRAGLKTALFTGQNIGGQLMYTEKIENYPGFDEISGPDLMDIFKKQITGLGATIYQEQITEINLRTYPFPFKSETMEGLAKSVIIATGSKARWLNVEGEEKFKGSGISVCATCDGFFYKNKKVAVIGGGNTALYEALFLSKVAAEVYLINKTDEFTGERKLLEQVNTNAQITILKNADVIAFQGNARLEKLLWRDRKTEKVNELSVDGVFEAVGTVPQTDLFQNQLNITLNGYINTNKRTMETSVKGVFACGDVQEEQYRQAIIASGSGCIAALSAEKFLLHKNS